MAYHKRFIDQVKAQPPTRLGVKLARWAIYHDISPAQIAHVTGATRQTAYNWMKGGEVFVAYRAAVEQLIKVLAGVQDNEDPWSKVCKAFNLKP